VKPESEGGLLSGEERDILMAQLVDQRAPERPTDEEAVTIVRWAEQARLRGQLLDMVLIGDMQVAIGPDGEPSYRLTPKGMESAQQMIATSRSAADLQARLIAGATGKTAVPEPENEQ
jgi:hypothetical protein